MQILDENEAKDLNPVRPGRYTMLYSKLLQLKPQQALIISPTEWKTKTLPYATIRRVAKNTGFKFDYGRTPDGKNWMAKRVG